MEDLKRKAVLLSLVEVMAAKGSWNGETHIQKVIFFLQELLEVPLGYEFVLYKHGPYSFDLHDELIEMKAEGFLRLKDNSPYGPSYVPGSLSEVLKSMFPKTISSYNDKLEFIAREISTQRVIDLEKIATALYVILEAGNIDEETGAKIINSLKPHIGPDDAKAAIARVSKIRDQAQSM